MPSKTKDLQHPVLSVVTVGLCSREIINTLSPFSQFLLDTRVEFIIVTPINNIGVIEKKISAVFVPDQGEGVYQAMNLGMSASSGDYLWFLNSGDISLLNPDRFVSLLGFLKRQKMIPSKNSLLLFGFQLLIFHQPWLHFLHASLVKSLMLFSVMPVSHQNILFLRSSHEPFSLRYRYSCDFEILSKLLFGSESKVLLASSLPIAKLVAGGISDSNRMSVFLERYSILRQLVPIYQIPLAVIGFLVRRLRELVASRIKSIIRSL